MTRMANTDGEIAPRLGEDFRSKVCILLGALGYVERLNRQYGIDWVGDPPPIRRSFIRPSFTPNGRIAFECRLGEVSLPSAAVNFKAKIDALRTGGNPIFSSVTAGVLVTGGRISDRKIQTALQSQIYCWDTRYLHFLAKKTDVFRTLYRLRQNVKERRLDDWTTLFMNLSPYEGYMELEAHIFYQNPLQEVDILKVQTMIATFNRSVARVTADFSSPIYIHLKIHSLALVTEGAEATFRQITSEEEGNPRYDSSGCFITSYATAPWFVYCEENK